MNNRGFDIMIQVTPEHNPDLKMGDFGGFTSGGYVRDVSDVPVWETCPPGYKKATTPPFKCVPAQYYGSGLLGDLQGGIKSGHQLGFTTLVFAPLAIIGIGAVAIFAIAMVMKNKGKKKEEYSAYAQEQPEGHIKYSAKDSVDSEMTFEEYEDRDWFEWERGMECQLTDINANLEDDGNYAYIFTDDEKVLFKTKLDVGWRDKVENFVLNYDPDENKNNYSANDSSSENNYYRVFGKESGYVVVKAKTEDEAVKIANEYQNSDTSRILKTNIYDYKNNYFSLKNRGKTEEYNGEQVTDETQV